MHRVGSTLGISEEFATWRLIEQQSDTLDRTLAMTRYVLTRATGKLGSEILAALLKLVPGTHHIAIHVNHAHANRMAGSL